jgi:exodeoxyribonuclease V
LLPLSAEQQAALDTIERWRGNSPEQVFGLAGCAGTGKTTLITYLRGSSAIAYAAPTGKAASLLRARGCANAMTVHQLIYGAPQVVKKNGRERLIWTRKESLDESLIVLDECSMLGRAEYEDLLSFGVKILLVGDPAQLPAIESNMTFEPDVWLTEVHRQAAGSQPLTLAAAIRAGGEIPSPQRYSTSRLLDADIVLCVFNATRRELNRTIRGRATGDYAKEPRIGDRVVCLRNNYERGVLNGTLWTIRSIAGWWKDNIELTLEDDIGNRVEVITPLRCFTHGLTARETPRYLDPFDYAYCLTVHKAQGSEWSRVVVIDETGAKGFKEIAGVLPLEEFQQRWRYTAVTRARDHVDVMTYC